MRTTSRIAWAHANTNPARRKQSERWPRAQFRNMLGELR